MEPSATAPGPVRFGVFEADLARRQLRKRGRKIPLQDQPFQVLALLLRHPGEIVTREELQAVLWPSGTFVEFEHGVNTAIKKLRQALGDSADNPRFIETLPRKGYRFIAPVAAPDGPTPEPAALLRRHWVWLPVGVAAVAIAAGCVLWLAHRPSQAPVPVPLTSYTGFEGWPTFSPDGQRVAFSWDGHIYVKQIGEEQPVPLTRIPAVDCCPAWSPDGRWIAFVRSIPIGTDLMYVPAVGGAERKITELRFGQMSWQVLWSFGRISWHPGGRWLVVPDISTEGSVALFLVSFDSGEKRQLTSPPRNEGDSDPAISPNGRVLVFARGADLYRLEVSDDLRPRGDPERITSMGCAKEPAWWPDGKSILFSAGGSCTNLGLWRMAMHGPGRRPGLPERLPFGGEGSQWRNVAISRQGRIAYMQEFLTAHIWRLDLSGSKRPELLPMSSTRLDHYPQYSPDGKRVAFASNRSGSHEIYVCDADGSNTVKLTSFGGPYVSAPFWSPDGRRIAFGGPDGIYIISADGGKPERLPGSYGGFSTWSRDGKWIYVGSDRSGRNEVWKIPVNGGNAVQLTKRGGRFAIESPDRNFIYYTRPLADRNKNTELWRVSVEGGNETRIADDVVPQIFGMAEDGVYFFAGGTAYDDAWGEPSVRCFRFAIGKVETLAKIEGRVAWGFSVSPDGRSILYSLYGQSTAESDLMLVENFR